jgi:hypothetical protein
MKKPMIMIEGFAGMRESEPFITTAENKKNTRDRYRRLDAWPREPQQREGR